MDNVNHPKHYNTGKIEVIEFIEDQQLGYHLGNAVKYICRAGKKDVDKISEDLQKAAWYINRAIEMCKRPDERRRPNEMNPTDSPKVSFICETGGHHQWMSTPDNRGNRCAHCGLRINFHEVAE